ncbi:MAG: single-stranded DNA-binding protein, partial [Dorea sp.]|nr:single-stranded DNA-binding protein [Dorea sp.]
MLDVIATSAVVSRGYDGAAALRFSEKGDAVRFRIGKKVYDSRAENNTRWINISVKAFGDVCERIKKMQLKDGSFINFRGRLDEDTWTDQQTGESKSAMV